MSYLRRYAPSLTVACAVAVLYLYGLSAVGVLGPDEPRYLAIGRAMAETNGYITPELWGVPWFEKPPLLYWLVAFGTKFSLGPELAGRLPVAVLSLAFLAAFYWLLRREFGAGSAAISTASLATCSVWIVTSSFALTDLPLAVFFSLALLLAVHILGQSPSHATKFSFCLLGVALGLATLAKGLVPLVLALPIAWFLRRHWRVWWCAGLACLAVAGPWYGTMLTRFGSVFVADFFWKHHVERLYSAALQHPQPVWFYVPVFLAGVFPWTPLFLLPAVYRMPWGPRHFLLASTVLFGLFAFSLSLNKLPAYLLPLLPAAFALLGATVDWQRLLAGRLRLWLLPSALLIGLLPVIGRALPAALEAGRVTFPNHFVLDSTAVFYTAAPCVIVLIARRSWVGSLLVLSMVAGAFFVKIVSFPVLDQAVSARGVWQQVKYLGGSVCSNWLNRDLKYGLELYQNRQYPACVDGQYDFGLESPGKMLRVVHRNPKS